MLISRIALPKLLPRLPVCDVLLARQNRQHYSKFEQLHYSKFANRHLSENLQTLEYEYLTGICRRKRFSFVGTLKSYQPSWIHANFNENGVLADEGTRFQLSVRTKLRAARSEVNFRSRPLKAGTIRVGSEGLGYVVASFVTQKFQSYFLTKRPWK